MSCTGIRKQALKTAQEGGYVTVYRKKKRRDKKDLEMSTMALLKAMSSKAWSQARLIAIVFELVIIMGTALGVRLYLLLLQKSHFLAVTFTMQSLTGKLRK